MATVRELQASFVAKVSGMKSAIQGVKKEINSLESSSGKTAGKMSTNFSSVGKTLTNFGNGLQQASQKVGTLGKSLTKKITLPAAGAATAIGGITAALGWKRLVGLDSAQAQLKGLGYNTKEVGRISKQVTKAIDGGMTTMAEGTSVAAGALAAGVKEGAELERYIKLVGDAAVGANRPVGDMAQIFNRVQGSGKLMTQELNMIEDGMPGFAQAMAKSLNVSQEEFRKMVTDGKVNSKKFLDVMEDFAGGMSSAYSDSWQGMVANTKAYIGIIGENLLGGVFEKSKESIAEFIEFLKSDEVIAWAQKVGKTLGVMFSNVVDKVQSAIQWFANLSKSQQSMIMKFGAVALAAGPILVVLGTLGGIVGKLSAGLGGLMTTVAKAGGVIKVFGAAFSLLTGPIGLTVAAISALAAGFIFAYKKSEAFRNAISKIGDGFKIALDTVKGVFKLFSKDMSSEYIEGIDIISKYLPPNAARRVVEIVDNIKSNLGDLKETFDKVSNGIKKGVEIVKGVFKLFTKDMSENYISGIDIISKYLPPDKAKAVVQAVDRMKENIHDALKAIADFFKEKTKEIRAFWDENGQQLLQAFSNIWSGIKAATLPVLKELVSAVKKSLPIINSILSVTFKIVLAVIKSVWGNIKGVIDGGLKFIMGLIQVFSGIFTGDFSKMWSGIKNIFTGAIQFIWNFVQLMFWGKMLKGILSLGKLLISAFKNSWTSIRAVFQYLIKSIVDFVKNRFTAMKNTVGNLAKGTQNILSKIWNSILSFFTKIVKSIFNFGKKWFTNLKNNISSIFTGIRNLTQKVWNSIKDKIVNPVKNAVNTAKNKFVNFKNNTLDLFRNVKKSVSNYVSDMVKNVKNMPGKMADGIKKMGGKVKDAMVGVGNKMIGGLGKGVNGVITGVNWVLKKLQVPKDKRLSKWTVPQYAKGTKGHPGGAAVVGDGRGNNAGQELIFTPDGRNYLSPAKDTLVNLPKGTQVLSAKLTKKLIPRYAKGTGIWESVKSGASKTGSAIKKGAIATKDFTVDTGKAVGRGVKKGAKKVAEWTGDIWDYVKSPGKLLNIALKKVGVDIPSAASTLGKMARGGFNKAKSAAVDYVKDKLNVFGGDNPPGEGVERWRNTVIRALGMNGLSTSKAMQDRVLRQIQTESGGNPKAVQGAGVWDINMAQGNPAKGLMQTIPSTFNAHKFPGHGNIFNGLDNLLAALHYAKNRYGQSLSFLGQGHGYANGGIVTRKQLAWIAEGGWAESIISHDPSKRVSQQRIWQETGDRLGFTRDKKDNKPTEFTQNLTINSPKALSPSEISRKNLQSLRRMAMEWGLK